MPYTINSNCRCCGFGTGTGGNGCCGRADGSLETFDLEILGCFGLLSFQYGGISNPSIGFCEYGLSGSPFCYEVENGSWIADHVNPCGHSVEDYGSSSVRVPCACDNFIPGGIIFEFLLQCSACGPGADPPVPASMFLRWTCATEDRHGEAILCENTGRVNEFEAFLTDDDCDALFTGTTPFSLSWVSTDTWEAQGFCSAICIENCVEGGLVIIYPQGPIGMGNSFAIESGLTEENVPWRRIDRPAIGTGRELAGLLAECGITLDRPEPDAPGQVGKIKACRKCEQVSAWMDRVGPALCRRFRGAIVSYLKKREKELGWGQRLSAAYKLLAKGLFVERWFNPLDPIGSIVDEAIKRAEAKEVEAKASGTWVATPVTQPEVARYLTYAQVRQVQQQKTTDPEQHRLRQQQLAETYRSQSGSMDAVAKTIETWLPTPAQDGWAYGVTTVPSRRGRLLPATLQSLKGAGFDKPQLFVDGDSDTRSWEREFGLSVTGRFPAVRTAGNWILSMNELYIRNPHAIYYAMFQDDLIACQNLRQYLETCPYPNRGYWNLFTFPENQALVPIDRRHQAKEVPFQGWYPSNQRGLGAVGLVFRRDALLILLQQPHLVERAMDPNRGWRAIDGGIVSSMKKAGFKEYVHSPSLIQHSGEVSTMENLPHPLAPSFPGEAFNAISLAPGKTYDSYGLAEGSFA